MGGWRNGRATAVKRQLKIKTGVVTRIYKEHKTYVQEEEQQRLTNEKLAASSADDVEDLDWKIKNGDNMMKEVQKIVKDATERLGKASLELRELVVSSTTDPEIEGSEELTKANEALEIINI